MRVTEVPLAALQAHPSQFLFHDLGGSEFDELVADIRERGIQQPVTVSRRTGELVIVDGHQRVRAAREAGHSGIPVVVQPFEDERAETLALVMANVRRRHLNREERRQVIAQMLKLYPEKSNNQHAKNLGVSDMTVKSVREELEATSQIGKLDKTVGADGKARTVAPKRPEATGQFAQSPETASSQPVIDTASAQEGTQVVRTPEPVQTVLAPVPPLAPSPEPEVELEPWQVDHSQVIDLTPTPFQQHLEAIGYEEAQSFEKLAQKLIAALTEFNRYSDGDLIAIAESKAGKGLYAPMRLRRINDLMEEARGRLRRREGTITVEALN